jgi:hypothetical protein|tara:strand:- start:95 stop:343 length:249 start_codon:yes stop_codon:yes gene_type:complete
MNILIICADDRSNNSIALNCIKHIFKLKKDKIISCVLDYKKEKSFVLNCLAQDFSFLKQQVKLYSKIYNCKLVLTPSTKKKW